MSAEQIIAIYDHNPEMTLRTLARRSGWTVAELKTLLLES
jgi:hypothetical protein